MKRTDRIYSNKSAQEKGHTTLVIETRSLTKDRKSVSVKRKPKAIFDTSAAIKFLKG